MNDKEVQQLRGEIQNLINKTKFCWVCGRTDLLTNHHAIPQRVKKPILNLTMPVCENCVPVIHNGDDMIKMLRKMFLK